MINKMTVKLQEAIQSAQQLAMRSAHSELKSTHVLLSLLQQDGGIVVPILESAGLDLISIKASVANELAILPTMKGATSEPQFSYGMKTTLAEADKEREKLGDEFMSVEHFLLGALIDKSPAGKLLETAGLTKKSLEDAYSESAWR